MNTNINNTDLTNSIDSEDSDEYIDLSCQVEIKNIYQFHLTNNKLIIKCIGKSSNAADIIIKENFGPKSNMSIYNCIYLEDELDYLNDKTNTTKPIDLDNLFYPIVKLIIKHDETTYTISTIAIKLNQKIIYEHEINEWELYCIKYSSLNKEIYKSKKIEKNINADNILENLIELSIC